MENAFKHWLPYGASLLIIFVFYAFLCAIAPLVCDDIGYTPYSGSFPDFKFDLFEILKQEVAHWLTWNGRSIASLINRLVLLRATWVSAMLNPLVMCSMLLLLEYIILGRSWRTEIRFWHPLYLFSCIWLFTPYFGEVYLWRTGSAYYLYTTCFVLCFLAVCRKYLDDPDFEITGYKWPLWITLSICAGWSNENIGLIPCFAASLMALYVKKRTGRISRGLTTGAILTACGWAMIIISPGQYIRAAKVAELLDSAGGQTGLQDFINWWTGHQLEFAPLTLIFLAGIFCCRKELKGRNVLTAIFLFLAAQASIAAFILSPLLSSRALANSCLLLTGSTGAFLLSGKYFKPFIRYSCAAASIGCAAVFAFPVTQQCLDQYAVWERRVYLLEHESSPVLPRYKPGNNRYLITSNLVDFDWPLVKEILIKWYNLNDLRLAEENAQR